MQKISITVMFLIILLIPNIVFASNGDLNSVSNKAIINPDGTVSIEQIWEYDDTNVSSGTEHFINLRIKYSNGDNIGEEEAITNYKVSLDNQPMEFVENWDIDNSFNDKQGKFGVINKGDSIELCFGITKHDHNRFKVEYVVHNAIKETSDGKKYFHWTFTPTDLDPKPYDLSAIIQINGNFAIDKIYGFNYNGQVKFEDMNKKDKVIARMDPGTYNSNTALNVFALFKDDSNVIMNTKLTKQTLDNKIAQIFAGSDYDISEFNKEAQQESGSIATNGSLDSNEFTGPIAVLIVIGVAFISLFTIVITFASPVLMVIAIISIANKMQYNRSIMRDVSKEQKKIWLKDRTFYRREEPEEIVGFLPVLDTIIHTPNMRKNILLYFISKWTSEGVFEYLDSTEEKGGILKARSTTVTFKIHKYRLSTVASNLELALFYRFSELAFSNNILNTKNLNKLRIGEIEKIFKDYEKNYKEGLANKGYVVGKNKEASITESGIEVINQHVGLKNFLRDFTLINEKEASEIRLWDYYFHMAALYGMADVFKKQLDKLPNLSLDARQAYNNHYGPTGTGVLNKNISDKITSSYSSYMSRNSGGGGSSSSGGGGGSSGGGSGGGTR